LLQQLLFKERNIQVNNKKKYTSLLIL